MFNVCYATRVSVLFFQEIGQLLYLTFKDLGFKCVSSVGSLREDSINIILDYHRIKYSEVFNSIRYIPYQLEQLDIDNWFYNENTLKLLKNATWVWDYSEENRDFLLRHGIKSFYMPIGFHQQLEKIQDVPRKDIDVLFYGTMNNRRTSILNEIQSKGLNVKILFDFFGSERDRYIARSKIVLNIHYYEKKMMETARLSYLLNNKVFVISENSPFNPIKDVGILCVNYNRIPKICMKMCKEDILRSRISIKNYNIFSKKYKMNVFVSNFIKNFINTA